MEVRGDRARLARAGKGEGEWCLTDGVWSPGDIVKWYASQNLFVQSAYGSA